MSKINELTDILKVEGVNAKGFGIVPKLVMQDRRLTRDAKAIYAYFRSYAGAGTSAFPSIAKIMHDLCFGSEDTYRKHFKLLVKYDYIQVKQERKEKGKFGSNVYTLIEKPNPVEPVEESQVEPTPKIKGTEKNPTPKFRGPDNSYPDNRDTKNNSLKSNSLSSKNNNNKETVVVEPSLIPRTKEIIPGLTDEDATALLIASKNDLERIKAAYEIARTYRQPISNLTAFLLQAIKESWKSNKKNPASTLNNFYAETRYDYAEIMKKHKNKTAKDLFGDI